MNDKQLKIAQKVARNNKNINEAQLDVELDILDTLNAIKENTTEKPEKETPEEVVMDLSPLVKSIETLTEEVKKKSQEEDTSYDLEISEEDRAKLKGDKGEKGEAGRTPTKAELQELIRELAPEFKISEEDLTRLVAGMEFVGVTQDKQKELEGLLMSISGEIEALKSFDKEEFSKELITKVLGFIPSRSGGGVTSAVSSDGSVIISSSMAKGKGVIDISATNRFVARGASANGTRDLTSANTWYAVPSTVPTSKYLLVVAFENSLGTIRLGYSNSGTPTSTNGIQPNTEEQFVLEAGEVVYYASSSAGDDVNWTTKII